MLFRRWAQARSVPQVTCYTRAGCCLCEQAHRALSRLAADGRVRVIYVDIDSDADLQARYGTRVPVVECDGLVLAEGKVSEVRLRRALDQRAVAAGGA